MKTIDHEIEIIEDNCTGCFYCERACPTKAISMIGPKKDALAVVDNTLCIACSRCIDVCGDDAIVLVRRTEPMNIGADVSEVDPTAITALCRAAGIEPKQSVCWCSGSIASEVSAAILTGHDSFEKLALVTGVQSGCLMYCSVTIRRLLLAHSGEATSTSKVKRYECEQGILDIPPELAQRYPTFGIAEEQAYVRARAEKVKQLERAAKTDT